MVLLDCREKETYKQYKIFITKQCVICIDDIIVPKSVENSIKTCSKECSNRRISLTKMTGIYVQCDYCDKGIYVEMKKIKGKNKRKNLFCSLHCNHEYRKNVEPLGTIDSSRVIGQKKYYGKNWQKQRRLARERDAYTCQMCGVTEEKYGQEMSVNHISPFVYFESYAEANELDNLECLCEPCHRKWHTGENNPANYRQELIKNKFTIKNGGVHAKHREIAVKIVDDLINTNETLGYIAKKNNVSRATVTRIYKGERWKELYQTPPIITNPRSKANVNKILHQSMV